MATKTEVERSVRTPDSLEKELLRDLRFAGMEKENLSELVSMVAGWQSAGFRHMKAFPLGTPVPPDGLEIRGILEQDRLSTLLQKILLESPRLAGVELFPYGTPFPEIFGIAVRLGAVRQAAPMQSVVGQV
jgi:hypothetical protein